MDYIFISLIIVLIAIIVVMYFTMQRNNSAKDRENDNKINLSEENIKRLDSQIAELRASNAAWEDRFKVLANESLNLNADLLRKSTSTEIEKLLNPLKERIEDFKSEMHKSNVDAVASRKSFQDQIDRLEHTNRTIGLEARNLATALKGNNRVQGQWGETVLETLLENSGLLPDENFELQVTKDRDGNPLKNDSGGSVRPDVIVHLPQKREIIIDSKASLAAYLEYCEAKDEESRKSAVDKHLNSIKHHIDELAAKNYPKSVPHSLEQVLLFIPNDGAFILAINTKQELIKYASERNITIVSPTQLTGILMIIDQLWRKEKQDRNAAQIAKIAGLIYDSIAGLANDMNAVGDSLDKARKNYDAALSRLSGSTQSLTARAERMRALGAKNNKKIPANMLPPEEESES